MRDLQAGLQLQYVAFVLRLDALHVCLCADLGGGDARIFSLPLLSGVTLCLEDRFDLLIGFEDLRRVDVLRLQRAFKQFLRVYVLGVDRVAGGREQLQERLVLNVSHDQRRAAPGVYTEVAFYAAVFIVKHVPVVAPTDVRLGHHVVELLDQSFKYDVGRGHQHLHAANGVRRCALLALHQRRNAGLCVGQLHGHLNDVGQLSLVAVEFKGRKGLAHVVQVVGGEPDLAG